MEVIDKMVSCSEEAGSREREVVGVAARFYHRAVAGYLKGPVLGRELTGCQPWML